IVRKVRREMRMQGGKIEHIRGDDGRHAGASIVARYGDAIDVGILDAGERVAGLGNLRGRHFLALPAAGVPDAVYEIEIAAPVLAHQIAGAEPGIALGEHVVQDLVLVLAFGSVALETIARLRWVLDDAADDLAGLVGRAAFAESLRVAHGLLALDIEAHHRDREAVRDE